VSSVEHLVGEERPAAERATGSVRQEWRLPTTELSVRWLRQGLRVVLDDTGLSPDDLYDLLVAACEAATNAIEHAQQPSEPFVDVRFEVNDGQVTIVVRDHGRWRHGPSGPYRGRGLQMMSALVDTTITSDLDGTTVTLCRPATGVGRGG
jgi:anti-sigma regulatory factor (Ser/Thr protein kinase)